MAPNELISTFDRLRVAAALGQTEAVDDLQALLQEQGHALAALGRAAAAAGRDDWPQVVVSLRLASSLEGEVARYASLLQAEAFISTGQPDQALDACDRWLQVEPGDLDAQVARARALFHLRRLDEAEPILSAALQRAPGHFQARFGLGLLLLARGRFDEALAELRQAQAANPLDPGPYRAMVQLFRMTGKVGPGAALLRDLLKDPLVLTPALVLDLAELELLAGDPDAVKPLLQTVREHAALEPLHLLELARLYCELMDGEALASLAQQAEASEHAQAEGVALVLRALELELQGKGEQARALHGHACTKLPGHWFPHVRAAILYLYHPTERNQKAARAHCREAARLAPQTPDVRLVQAMLATLERRYEARAPLEVVANHPGMRPSLRRIAKATLVVLGNLEAADRAAAQAREAASLPPLEEG